MSDTDRLAALLSEVIALDCLPFEATHGPGCLLERIQDALPLAATPAPAEYGSVAWHQAEQAHYLAATPAPLDVDDGWQERGNPGDDATPAPLDVDDWPPPGVHRHGDGCGHLRPTPWSPR